MVATRGKLKPKPGSQSPRPEERTDVMKLLADMLKPVVEQLNGINQQLTSLNQNFALQQHQLAETDKKVEQVTEKIVKMDTGNKKMKKRVGEVEIRQNLQENRLLQLQMEKANMILRFQGVPETEKDLKETLAKAIAPVTGLSAEEIVKDMETVYRAYSNYILKNSLPGEIVVRFARRQTRDAILKATSATPLKLGNTIIKTLKDIPFEIRQKRKTYKDLISFLQTNGIQYRWGIPKGVIFKINDKREKIDSIFKAKEFLRRQLGTGEESKEEETKSSDSATSGSDEDSAAEAAMGATKTVYDFRDRKPK